MLSLMRAELQKALNNRWAIGFTVWIFPVGALALFSVFTVLFLVGLTTKQSGTPDIRWDAQLLYALNIPTNPFGQVFLIAFCAIVFASESSLNTWKNIIPRTRRLSVILAKFGVVSLLITISLVLTGIVASIGGITASLAARLPISPAFNDPALSDFFRTYFLNFGLALVSTFMVACYGMLGALLAKSTIAGVGFGVGLMLLDQFLPALLALISRVLNIPQLVLLHHWTPSYNIANAGKWVLENQGYSLWTQWQGLENVVPNTLGQSVLIVLGWFVLVLGLALYWFQRRDIS